MRQSFQSGIEQKLERRTENKLLGNLGGGSTVAFEHTGGRELAQTVSDHVFRDIDADEVLAVVNQEGVPNEIRRDHGGASPGFDRAFDTAAFVELVDLPEEFLVDEWSFFK